MRKGNVIGVEMLILTLSIPVITTDYPLHCPHNAQRQLRSKAFCNVTHPAYRCLFDEFTGKTVERCEKYGDYQTPGFKFILRGGYDGEPCSENRFQPFKFGTNVSSDCVFLKSTCEDEGQLLVNIGSNIKDISCTCDYTRGYAFIESPRSKYYCFPFKEDCSCYIKECGGNSRLTSEFTCVPKETVIERVNGDTLGQVDRMCPLSDPKEIIYSKPIVVSSRSLCAIVVLQLIFLIIVASVVLFWNKET